MKPPPASGSEKAGRRRRPPGATRGQRLSRILKILGPGLVTGAADDDPSGIATYSQAGAQFEFGTLWTMLLTFPLMVAVQDACMRIGTVTGEGLAAIVGQRYPKWVLYPIVFLVVAANTFNIGSDIGAMAASTELLMPMLPLPVFAIGFSALILILGVFIAYRVYIFGTTISPYLFFWQTSNTVEDKIAENRTNTDGAAPTISRRYLSRLRVDTVIGMFFSNLVAWFIILVGAVVLNSAGVTNIVTAADAAKALTALVHSFPNSGYLAQVIFATGVIAIGLMSIPVLAGSSASTPSKPSSSPPSSTESSLCRSSLSSPDSRPDTTSWARTGATSGQNSASGPHSESWP